ncbi:MAG: exo-alpha-sialidase [Bacteroidales bacterium]|nr:exo-alpha-sialidase [Bacteroidales bacterium]
MKAFLKSIFSLALLVAACTPSDDARARKLPEVKISWEEPLVLSAGGYVRVHPLTDGRLMCSYTHGGRGYARYSSDGGASWTDQEVIVNSFTAQKGDRSVTVTISNPETAQLPLDYPVHPGRLFYTVNLRPKDGLSTIHPYGIACRHSDDGGKTWSELSVLYLSEPWDTDTKKGCWEPFILPLPDGTLHLYYSDETPYYREGNKYQNISLLESRDGGDSWTGEPRIVCYTPKFRDGMPVAMIYEDRIYLSIETNNVDVRLHPQLLYTQLSNPWPETEGEFSPRRFDPMLKSMESPEYTTGAPYLIQTENFFVLSWQTSRGADVKDSNRRIMEVAACPKSEMKNCTFSTMRGISHPIDADIQTESVMWNSLTPLGGDAVLACCMYNGKVTLVKGVISL